ncbi:hypothetical protein [Christiangramia sp. SM2212]|uniref:Uncharacterized protein n=1 Tax=Christiangramia sediminicola TaxID=3073267 RepID=A0ABU1EMQ8_9FLAO|nr:hypothetical protein [Christiangramia sp. SM2212]MDR5589670.1 hypothetical protein [Christiangramia sp. SM2212]
MEKQFSREDRLMKKLLNEAGTEKPSAAFKNNIMAKLEARNLVIRPYEPLISKTGWILIAVFVSITMSILFYLHSDISLSNHINFNFMKKLNFPKIEMSRNMQYAIAFVALFFLQIPFLKRFMDREYRL